MIHLYILKYVFGKAFKYIYGLNLNTFLRVCCVGCWAIIIMFQIYINSLEAFVIGISSSNLAAAQL